MLLVLWLSLKMKQWNCNCPFLCCLYLYCWKKLQYRAKIIALTICASEHELVEKPGELSYLLYTENSSCSSQGGLNGCNAKQNKFINHQNVGNPSRCPVRILKLYKQLCPQETNCKVNAYYNNPLEKKNNQKLLVLVSATWPLHSTTWSEKCAKQQE